MNMIAAAKKAIAKEKREDPLRYLLTSHSIDNTFDYCPRKFEFLNVWDKRPPRDSGFAADVGTALHNGWQAWLIARAEGENESRCTVAAFMALARDYPWDRESEQTTSIRSFNNTCLVLYQLIRSPEWDDWELVKVEGKGWAIEVPFLIKHTSLGEFRIKATGERSMLATQGKIDAVLRHKRTGKIRGWDLKTSSKPAELIRSEYTFSGQQVGYGSVVHAALGMDMDDLSVWYMIARFNASDLPDILPLEYIKADWQVDDYWLAKLDRLERMKKYAETGWFPRTNGGCNSWQRECAFFDICHTRDNDLIRQWFRTIEAIPQGGYEPWITMEV